MAAGEPSIDVRALPSLREQPCLYPDARAPADRAPYVYARGSAVPLGEGVNPAALLSALGGAGLERRVSVLAVGSNAYPRQLLDKFRQHAVDDDSVPTLRCTVPGAGVSYVAALSGKGYVPVGLRPQPGADCVTWLQLLTLEQLAVIAASEGRDYRLVRVPSVVAPALGGAAPAYGWAHERLLDLGSGPIAMGELSQSALLGELVGRVDPRAEWDGCRVSPRLHEELKAWLPERGIANDLPESWTVVDRERADSPACLLE